MKLSDFDALSFDCYGTLIDWETGLLAALRPWLEKHGANPSDEEVLAAYSDAEPEMEDRYPSALYPVILSHCHDYLANHFKIPTSDEDKAAFAASIGDWPAFPDTAPALKYLKEHYKLFVLSNIDRASFARTNRLLGVEFDGIYTAEDIGSYKPDERNFHFMLKALEADHGVTKSNLLHVAQSLYHDHVPAKNLGLTSAWIDRRALKDGSGATTLPDPMPAYDFRFETMGAFAAAHKAEHS